MYKVIHDTTNTENLANHRGGMSRLRHGTEVIQKWNIYRSGDHMKLKSTHPKKDIEIGIKIERKIETETEIDTNRREGEENVPKVNKRTIEETTEFQ